MKKRTKIAVTALGLLFCAQAAVAADPKVPVLPGGGFLSVPVEKVVVPPANGKEKKAQSKTNGEKATQGTKQVIVPVPSGKVKPALKLPPAPGPGRQAGKEKTAPPVVKLPPATLEKVVPPAAPGKKPASPARPRVPVVAVPGGKGFPAPSAAADKQKGSSSGVIPRLPPVRLDKGLPPAGGRTASGKGEGNGSGFPVLPSTSLGKVLEQSGKTRKPDGKAPAPVIEGLKLPGKEILTGDKKVPGSKGQMSARGFPVPEGVPEGARPVYMGRVVLEGVIEGGDPRAIRIRIHNSSFDRARMVEVRLWEREDDDSVFPLIYDELESGAVREERIWIGRSPDGSGRVWEGLELAAGECLEGVLSWHLAGSGETRRESIRVCPVDLASTRVEVFNVDAVSVVRSTIEKPVISRVLGAAWNNENTCVNPHFLRGPGLLVVSGIRGGLVFEGRHLGTQGVVQVRMGSMSSLFGGGGVGRLGQVEEWTENRVVFTVPGVNPEEWASSPAGVRLDKQMLVELRTPAGKRIASKVLSLCPINKMVDVEVLLPRGFCRDGSERDNWMNLYATESPVRGGALQSLYMSQVARLAQRVEETETGEVLRRRYLGVELPPWVKSLTINYTCPPTRDFIGGTGRFGPGVYRILVRVARGGREMEGRASAGGAFHTDEGRILNVRPEPFGLTVELDIPQQTRRRDALAVELHQAGRSAGETHVSRALVGSENRVSFRFTRLPWEDGPGLDYAHRRILVVLKGRGKIYDEYLFELEPREATYEAKVVSIKAIESGDDDWGGLDRSGEWEVLGIDAFGPGIWVDARSQPCRLLFYDPPLEVRDGETLSALRNHLRDPIGCQTAWVVGTIYGSNFNLSLSVNESDPGNRVAYWRAETAVDLGGLMRLPGRTRTRVVENERDGLHLRVWVKETIHIAGE